jgi:polyhydroxyalkanoate synthase
MVDILDDKVELENFLRMEKWIFDSPDQAGEAFRQFVKDFYQGNKLVNGGLEIGDKSVSLKKITMPVLNIFAEQDHLVPPSASRPLQNLIGTKDYTSSRSRAATSASTCPAARQREVPSRYPRLARSTLILAQR